jgi:hypothetical protein
MAARSAGDRLGSPTLISEGWDVPRQFTEAERRLWLLEPCLTNPRAARERYGLPSLRETIALDWGHASRVRTWTSGGAPFVHHTGPKPHALSTLAAAVAEAVLERVTIATLLDPKTPSLVMEEVAWLFAASTTPAWPDPAERMTHVAARQRALLEAIVDAKEPQPRLRIRTKQYGHKRAAITLAPADRDAWVWQRARGHLTGRVRRERLPPPSPADALADTVGMENLISLTQPSDPSWSKDATFLLGSVVLGLWDQLVPEDRALIQTALKAQSRSAASLPE